MSPTAFFRAKLPEPRRLAMATAGVVFSGVSVAFFKLSCFGVDPFQTLCNGIYSIISFTGVSYGTAYALLNAVMLLAVLLVDRHYVGIATALNLFGIGYLCDLTQAVLTCFLPEPVLWQRCVLLAAGLAILCVSASLYFTADLGVSAYDAVALLLRDRGARFSTCRVAGDFTCVLVGSLLLWLSGGEVFSLVGVGTVLTAFFMGPVVALCNRRISEPLLRLRRKHKSSV